MTHKLKVASGIARGRLPTHDLARLAISRALEKAGLKQARSVLLFLTSDFAGNPQAAIKSAAACAQTTQIIGCSASGIFTEEEWILDSPAVAAMVFSEDIFCHQQETIDSSQYLMTLAAPNAINSSWLQSAQYRFGGVSGDATGHGPFSVWQNGKGTSQGYCQLALNNCTVSLGTSHGLRLISTPAQIHQVESYDILMAGEKSATASLQAACLQEGLDIQDPPYHRLMIAYAKSQEALTLGQYAIASIILMDETTHSITLSHPLSKDDWFCWAIRDTHSAQTDMSAILQRLKDTFTSAPQFALMFSCLGRGPYFYNGEDQDLALLTKYFPELPVIGFYGNGEIAPINHENALLQYSTVTALISHGDS